MEHEETIDGGITRETVADAFRFCDGELPLCMLMNDVTACEFGKFHPHIARARQELLRHTLVTTEIDNVVTHITTDRQAVFDDQIRIFTDKGHLYVINFV